MNQNIIIITLFAFLFVSCQNKNEEKEVLNKISCRLKWYHQSQFAGLYVAQKKKYFEKKNIVCTLNQGSQQANAVLLVASGSDDFGICGADQVIIARSKGIPIVCIGVILQESPVCFFWKENTDIESPKDFVGRSIAMQYGTNVRTEYVAMMRLLGIDMKSIDEVPTDFSMQLFFDNKVDIWNGYIFNEPQIAIRNNIQIVTILPRNYGVDMYADCIITTEQLINSKPELVKDFVECVVDGWKYALNNLSETVDITLKMDARLNYEHEYYMLKEVNRLVIGRNINPNDIGIMSRDVWEKMYNELLQQDIVNNRDLIIDELFSNKYLPIIRNDDEIR